MTAKSRARRTVRGGRHVGARSLRRRALFTFELALAWGAAAGQGADLDAGIARIGLARGGFEALRDRR